MGVACVTPRVDTEGKSLEPSLYHALRAHLTILDYSGRKDSAYFLS